MRQRISMAVTGLFLAAGVYAGGIPTVDVGVIAQQIRAYQQQLRDFEIQLRQAGINSEQLSVLNRQFEQAIREYDDYLQQVRGLHRVISREDWNRLFQILENQRGVSAYSRIPALSATGAAGRRAIDAQVAALYSVPAPADEVRRQTEAGGMPPEPWVTHARRQRARYEVYRDQLEIAKDSSRELLERYRKVKITKDNFDLSDKSDLNALHTMATSHFHIIDELQALNNIQNQRLLHANHEYMYALALAEAQRRAEAARLEKLGSRAGPSRSFRWSDLDILE